MWINTTPDTIATLHFTTSVGEVFNGTDDLGHGLVPNLALDAGEVLLFEASPFVSGLDII